MNCTFGALKGNSLVFNPDLTRVCERTMLKMVGKRYGMNRVKQKMDEMWKFMFEQLFCDKTKLFYDVVVPEHRGDFAAYLPNPEMIKAGIPNPCGWGTGMEDAMIIGSVMLSAAIDACAVNEKKETKQQIKDIFAGMKTCASVSNSDGFLARSVSPVDGTTHYINSSRDQYTHWIFSSVKYIQSGLADDEEIAFIKKTLCAFARRARKNVTAENNWDLLREDEKVGLVTKMCDCMPHEIMRLPMIYLAAWRIGEDESFKEDYLKIRDTAFASMEGIQVETYSKLFAINQMQLSLKFVYDWDDDAMFQQRCFAIMKKIADYALLSMVECAEKNALPENAEQLNYQAKPWDTLLAWPDGFVSGYAYYAPLNTKHWSDLGPKAAWAVREVSDSAMIYLNLPNVAYHEKVMEALSTMAGAIDLKKHTTDAPAYLLEAYYALMRIQEL